MRVLLPLLLIFLLIPIANAEEITLFSGTVVPYNIYYTAEKQPFTVDVLPEVNKVIIHLPEVSMVASNKTCVFNSDYEFCVDTILFSHYNYTTATRMVYKATVKLKTDRADLNINRTIEPLKLYIGQQANLKVILNNPGSVTAYNARYVDNLSEFFDVLPLAVSECTLNQGVISWQGDIPPTEVVNCFALLQAKKNGTKALASKVDFTTRSVNKSKTDSKTITIKESPLNINHTSLGMRVGKNYTLIFNITSTENLTIGSLWLNMSPDLAVIRSEGIELISGSSYYIRTELQTGSSKLFKFNVMPTNSGILPITFNYKVLFSDIILDYLTEYDVNATISQLQPSLASGSFSAGAAELNVLVNNPTNYSYKNITIEAGSPVNAKGYLASVEALGHRNVLVPFSAQAGNSIVQVKVTYYSEFDEKFEKTFSQNISVSGKASSPEQKQQQQTTPKSQKSESTLSKSLSANAKYVALAAIAVVVAIIVFIYLKHRSEQIKLGA
jgi:hypothetical protein